MLNVARREVPLHADSFTNHILGNLSVNALARLQLRPVTFAVNKRLEVPGDPIKHVYFLESGLASMATRFRDGTLFQVELFGDESIVGATALMGTRKSFNYIYTQIQGHGWSSLIDNARKEFACGAAFQSLVLGCVQSHFVMAAQSVGCRSKHNINQRLARWLLIYKDRTHSNTFQMSHEALAEILGCVRPTVSVAAGLLRSDQLIAYRRREFTILDVEGLEARSCECYRAVRDHLANVSEFDDGKATVDPECS
jgi:CRP-like cAMP-binding protein